MLALYTALIAVMDAAQAVETAATKGPWQVHDDEISTCGETRRQMLAYVLDDYPLCYETADLIALSRNALPPLLASLRGQAEHNFAMWKSEMNAVGALSEADRVWDSACGMIPYHAAQLLALARCVAAAFPWLPETAALLEACDE